MYSGPYPMGLCVHIIADVLWRDVRKAFAELPRSKREGNAGRDTIVGTTRKDRRKERRHGWKPSPSKTS